MRRVPLLPALLAGLLAALSAPLPATAATTATVAATRAGDDLESPRQTWLIDQTRSQLGGEFFRAFASAWRETAHGPHMVAVEESGGPFHAHAITVRVGQRVLLQTRLFASQRASLDRLGATSAAQAAQRLADWQGGAGSDW